jgi:hypothetical protein
MRGNETSRNIEDEPAIKWLELAVSSRWRDSLAAVHLLTLSEGSSCFGVTLDGRWLRSSDGALTCFDSMAAATRFLQLLNVNSVAVGDRPGCSAAGRNAFQCFHLDGHGLRMCAKCSAGDEARSAAAREYARWEDRW